MNPKFRFSQAVKKSDWMEHSRRIIRSVLRNEIVNFWSFLTTRFMANPFWASNSPDFYRIKIRGSANETIQKININCQNTHWFQKIGQSNYLFDG